MTSLTSRELAGRTALITGAGRGIGAAIAEAFVAAGASVMLAARTADELASTARRLGGNGEVVEWRPCDVSDPIPFAELMSHALTRFGAIDILVNNAGVLGPVGPFSETPLDTWWEAVSINVKAAAVCSRGLIPHFRTRGRGKIINLSGGGAVSPRPNFSAYSVAKAAIVRLSENLAEELRGDHVDVNAIAPGAVDTRMQEEILKAGERAGYELAAARAVRNGEAGVPVTLAAELAVFLASESSDGLTGKLISAPHDPWREWAGRGSELSASPMYTLRRLDPFTFRQLKDQV